MVKLTSGQAFTGREWDPESGLYYYRARYYAPRLGRFLSEDPAGLSESLHFYSYAANNPTLFTDPSGRAVSLNLFRRGSPERRAAQKYTFKNDPNYTVAAHGRSGSWDVLDDRRGRLKPITPKDLATEIKDGGWDCKKPVKLLVCWAGKGTYAKTLAKELGHNAKVLATPGFLDWMDSPYLAPDYFVAEEAFVPFTE